MRIGNFYVLIFDKDLNICKQQEYNNIKPFNKLYGECDDNKYIILSNYQLYNRFTKCGRKKKLDLSDIIFIEAYINAELLNSFKYKFKTRIKEWLYIFYTTVIKNKKIYKLDDVAIEKQKGIQCGLEALKKLSTIK